MKSLFSLFKYKTKNKSDESDNWIKGYEAFKEAKKFYINRQDEEALKLLDKSIEFGFEDEVYEMRGICLQSLKYDLDAIEDFDKAIAKSPDDANLYFVRSLSKSSTGDLEGCVADLEEAIRLSKIDNKINTVYNSYAQEHGWDSVSDLFYSHLQRAKTNLNEAIEQRNWSDEKKKLLWGEEKVKWTYPHWLKINKKRRFN